MKQFLNFDFFHYMLKTAKIIVLRGKFPEIPRKFFPGDSGSKILENPRGFGDGEFRGPALPKFNCFELLRTSPDQNDQNRIPGSKSHGFSVPHFLGPNYKSYPNLLILAPKYLYGTLSIPIKFQLNSSSQLRGMSLLNIGNIVIFISSYYGAE